MYETLVFVFTMNKLCLHTFNIQFMYENGIFRIYYEKNNIYIL